jgi:PGF-CTERM protein
MRRSPDGSRRDGALLALLVVVGTVLGSTAAVTAQNESSVSIVHEGDDLVVPPAENATISGESDLAPGTTLTVRVQSTGDTQPRFIRTADDVAVAEDGRFSATFDLQNQSTGDTFEVTVVRNGTQLASVEGRIDADAATTETTTSQPLPGFGVGVAAAALLGTALLLARRN